MISMGPPDPSYIGVVGKVLAENLKKKSKTLEDSGRRTRIKTVDIIFRSLRIIFNSFHSVHTRSNISELRQFICKIHEKFIQDVKGNEDPVDKCKALSDGKYKSR
jgi:hypothetical protein